MKKLILILMLSICLISLVNATQGSLGVFKRGECMELIQTCSDCTYNNISSVLYPNSSIAVSNVKMSKDDTYYNYTFCLTNLLGTYQVNGYGDDDGTKDIWVYDFEITQTGTILESSDSIIYIIVLIGSVGLFLLCLYGSLRIPWRHPKSPQGFIKDINYLKHFKIACVFMSYLFLIWIFNILSGITNNFLFLTISYNYFSTIYIILLTGLMVVVPLTAFVIVINLINDKRIKNALNRGIRLE